MIFAVIIFILVVFADLVRSWLWPRRDQARLPFALESREASGVRSLATAVRQSAIRNPKSEIPSGSAIRNPKSAIE